MSFDPLQFPVPRRGFSENAVIGQPHGRRAALAVLGGCAALAGCAKSPFFTTIATFNRRTDSQINRAKVDSIAYASLLAWFDGSSSALLVLGEYLPENRLIWYSAEQQAMTTWGAFVLNLVGTEVALRSTALSGRWESDPRKLVGRALVRTLDYEAASGRATVNTVSNFHAGGVEVTKVFDTSRRLNRVTEKVIANKWHHWSNEYWVDDSGFCWKSRQNVVPTMPPLNIVITKPALPAPPVQPR